MHTVLPYGYPYRGLSEDILYYSTSYYPKQFLTNHYSTQFLFFMVLNIISAVLYSILLILPLQPNSSNSLEKRLSEDKYYRIQFIFDIFTLCGI